MQYSLDSNIKHDITRIHHFIFVFFLYLFYHSSCSKDQFPVLSFNFESFSRISKKVVRSVPRELITGPRKVVSKLVFLWQPQPRETKRGRTKNKYYRFTHTHTLFEDTGLATIGARELRLAVLDKDDHHWQRRIHIVVRRRSTN